MKMCMWPHTISALFVVGPTLDDAGALTCIFLQKQLLQEQNLSWMPYSMCRAAAGETKPFLACPVPLRRGGSCETAGQSRDPCVGAGRAQPARGAGVEYAHGGRGGCRHG